MATGTRNIEIDIQQIFESLPDLYLILSTDFTILYANKAYLDATLTTQSIFGRALFDVFPDNPDDPHSNGVMYLSASLNEVMRTGLPHRMQVQKYDIQRPDGTFEERFWRPLNTPVLNKNHKIQYLIHKVEDVTVIEQQKKYYQEFEIRNQSLMLSEKEHQVNLKQSEFNFSKIFEFCPVAILKIDMEAHEVIRVNKEFELLFGCKRATLIGRNVIEAGILDTVAVAALAKSAIGPENSSEGVEIEVIMDSGAVKNVLASADVIEVNKRRCYLVAMMDITHRKQMEEKLVNTNVYLDTILDNLPNMVFVKDAETLKFVSINTAGERLLGFNKDVMIGKNDFDFFPPGQVAFFAEKDQLVFESGVLIDIEEPILTKSGERWLHTKKIPVYRSGKPVYLVGISEDITDAKLQRDAIMDLNRELEAFSYSVSHDLRAPLRAIASYAQILEDDHKSSLPTEGSRMLTRIVKNAEKMGRLIDDLLAFSKLGRKEILKKSTDMNVLVVGVVSELRRIWKHEFIFKIGALHNVKCDRDMIRQVIFNLIDNAIKYSSKDAQPIIEVVSVENEIEWVFKISDNGVGFDALYADKLFGVFQRLHRSDEFEGTGVGLAIVDRIIKKHGGRVWAESKLDNGATFYFTLSKNEEVL